MCRAVVLFVLTFFVFHGFGLAIAKFPETEENADCQLIKLSPSLRNWTSKKVIEPTSKAPARTAVLIISPANQGNDQAHKRWRLGRAMWEQYMTSQPNVDCFFLQTTARRPDRSESDQVWIDGNTIYVGDIFQEKYGNDRICYKTIAALKYLVPHYTHFIRTNLNSVFNLANLNAYAETHHNGMFTTPFWQGEWYAVGYSMLFTQDVAQHMVSEYDRIEKSEPSFIWHDKSDDCVLTSLATGIFPLGWPHPYHPCPSLVPGEHQLMCKDGFSAPRINQYAVFLLPPISLSTAKQYCEMAGSTPILYRNREGFSLDELAQLYEYLLNKCYPNLEHINMVDYAKSLSN